MQVDKCRWLSGMYTPLAVMYCVGTCVSLGTSEYHLYHLPLPSGIVHGTLGSVLPLVFLSFCFPSFKFCWFLVFYSGTNFGVVPQILTSCPSSKSTAYLVGLFLEHLSFLLWYVPEHYIAFCTVCSVSYGLELWLWASWALYSDSENAGPTPVLGSFHELNKSNEWINFKDWRFTCQISLNCFLLISLVCSFCGNEFSSSSKLGYVFRISICFYGLFFIFNSLTHLKFIV